MHLRAVLTFLSLVALWISGCVTVRETFRTEISQAALVPIASAPAGHGPLLGARRLGLSGSLEVRSNTPERGLVPGNRSPMLSGNVRLAGGAQPHSWMRGEWGTQVEYASGGTANTIESQQLNVQQRHFVRAGGDGRVRMSPSERIGFGLEASMAFGVVPYARNVNVDTVRSSTFTPISIGTTPITPTTVTETSFHSSSAHVESSVLVPYFAGGIFADARPVQAFHLATGFRVSTQPQFFGTGVFTGECISAIFRSCTGVTNHEQVSPFEHVAVGTAWFSGTLDFQRVSFTAMFAANVFGSAGLSQQRFSGSISTQIRF